MNIIELAIQQVIREGKIHRKDRAILCLERAQKIVNYLHRKNKKGVQHE